MGRMLLTEQKDGWRIIKDQNGKTDIKFIRSAIPLRELTTCITFIDQLERCCDRNEFESKISALTKTIVDCTFLDDLEMDKLMDGLSEGMTIVDRFRHQSNTLQTLCAIQVGDIGLSVKKKIIESDNNHWSKYMIDLLYETYNFNVIDKYLTIAAYKNSREYAYLGIDLLYGIAINMEHYEDPQYTDFELYLYDNGIFAPPNLTSTEEIIEAKGLVQEHLSFMGLYNNLSESPEYKGFKSGQEFIKNINQGVLFQLDERELKDIQKLTANGLKKISTVLKNKQKHTITEIQLELPLEFPEK